MVTRPLITVVDDDESVRESLPDLLKEFGFEARTFSSAEEFLASDLVDETKCLVLDVAMPGMSGQTRSRRRLIPPEQTAVRPAPTANALALGMAWR